MARKEPGMQNRMEILKPDPVIDDNYKPSMDMSYQDYFNRAMVFAQTNYNDQLAKLANTHFKKMAPTAFFEEYVWCVCNAGLGSKTVSKYFPTLVKELQPYRASFWDLTSFPTSEAMLVKLMPLVHNQAKCQAVQQGAYIVHNGIRLFGWDNYRDNFLSSTKKLQALPMIGPLNSIQLGRNIGFIQSIGGGAHLVRMASRWGFDSPEALCKEIAKHVVLQPRVIGLILWYAGSTFGTNIT
jgi:hypothetical protein